MQSAQSWKKSCSMVHKVGLNEKADRSRLGSMYNKFDANSTIGKVTNLIIIQLAFVNKKRTCFEIRLNPSSSLAGLSSVA